MRNVLVFLILTTSIHCQNFYGLSQLDSYFRLLRSRNLGGFGTLDNIQSRIATAEKQQLLSGLPPLPMTADEVIHVLTTTMPTTTQKPTARPTTPSPMMTPSLAVINDVPEIPPIPEERIGGTYDADGNFVESTKSVLDRKRNLALGARNYQLSNTAATRAYILESNYKQQQRRVRQQNTQRPRIPTATFPPLIFRAKPQPQNREPYLNNLLLEIEEYDDFLDQVNQYRSRYPAAQVPNPYRSLPEGKLPALSLYNKQKK